MKDLTGLNTKHSRVLLARVRSAGLLFGKTSTQGAIELALMYYLYKCADYAKMYEEVIPNKQAIETFKQLQLSPEEIKFHLHYQPAKVESYIKLKTEQEATLRKLSQRIARLERASESKRNKISKSQSVKASTLSTSIQKALVEFKKLPPAPEELEYHQKALPLSLVEFAKANVKTKARIRKLTKRLAQLEQSK